MKYNRIKTKVRKKLMTALIILVILAIVGFLAGRFLVIPEVSKRPDNLGVTDGKLKACPQKPNCVNSQAENGYPAMEPIPFNGTLAEAKTQMLDVVEAMERSTIVSENEDYIHAEFRSQLWGFVDDTEFYFDAEDKVVHFRSAARLGQSDLQANRRRMQDIRRRFQAVN